MELAIASGLTVPTRMLEDETALDAINLVALLIDGVHVGEHCIEVADVDDVHSRAVSRGLNIVYPLTNEPWVSDDSS